MDVVQSPCAERAPPFHHNNLTSNSLPGLTKTSKTNPPWAHRSNTSASHETPSRRHEHIQKHVHPRRPPHHAPTVRHRRIMTRIRGEDSRDARRWSHNGPCRFIGSFDSRYNSQSAQRLIGTPPDAIVAVSTCAPSRASGSEHRCERRVRNRAIPNDGSQRGSTRNDGARLNTERASDFHNDRALAA